MRKWRQFGVALLLGGVLLGGSQALAGGKIAIDETKWISVGAGLKTSFAAREDGAPNGSNWSTNFKVDNVRLYFNGQIHKYIKLEVNTECVFCGNSSLERFALLDAIAKIEINQYFNIWAGRLLVPAERREMNGPFYSSTFDPYKTPFYSADFSTKFGAGGAGVYERSQGVNVWGAAGPDGAFQYVVGVFDGLQSSKGSGPNQGDHPMVAGRIAYNFLNVEKNPGYYTSGTYYGGAGDVLTIAAALQYQQDGSGSFEHPGNFLGFSTDLLFEKPISDRGVLTLNGEYKHFDADYSSLAFAKKPDGTDIDHGNFGMFDGDSFSILALYLLPQTVGIGQFQPYARYTGVYPNKSSDRDEDEAGLNYIIDGHNARVSLFYQYGDIATKGLNYAPNAHGKNVNAVKLAIQLQI